MGDAGRDLVREGIDSAVAKCARMYALVARCPQRLARVATRPLILWGTGSSKEKTACRIGDNAPFPAESAVEMLLLFPLFIQLSRRPNWPASVPFQESSVQDSSLVIPAAPGQTLLSVIWTAKGKRRPCEEDIRTLELPVVGWLFDGKNRTAPVVPGRRDPEDWHFLRLSNGRFMEESGGPETYADATEARAFVLEILQDQWDMREEMGLGHERR